MKKEEKLVGWSLRFALGGAVTVGTLCASAAVWPISPETVEGLTPTEQLTNAVQRAAAGDTIAFAAGVYQLDGKSYMNSYTTASSAGAVTTRNYLVLGKDLAFAGPESGHWSDAAVLRGTGIDRFIEATSGTTFRNLTFENFAANDHPDRAASSGNLATGVCGGAVYYTYDSTAVAALSNCVFRGNVARSAGATGKANAYDCLFTNNVARSYVGGATLYGTMHKCVFACNMATNSGCGGGAAWWPKGLYDCTFVGNACHKQGGAIVGETGMIVSNCLFRTNRTLMVTTGEYCGGGVVHVRQNELFVDCRFEGNSSCADGGVIHADKSGDTSNGGKGTRFVRCAFVGNSSTASGGVLYSGLIASDGELPFVDCVFSNNTAATHGGAAYGGSFSNCTFVGNAAGVNTGLGGALYLARDIDRAVGCAFASNRLTAAKDVWGAAIYAATSCRVARCSFVGNIVKNKDSASAVLSGSSAAAKARVVDCAFTNNYSAAGAIVRYGDCANTVFYGNEVVRNGGMVYESRATDCRFTGNRKYDTFGGLNWGVAYGGIVEANNPAGDAYRSDLVRCDLDGGCITDCTLLDCTVHSLTNLGCYCAFYANNAATNCLISSCRPGDPDQRGLLYRWGPFTCYVAKRGEFVNCTFADNTYTYFLRHAQEAGVTNRLLNCLFVNNRDAKGVLTDVTFLCTPKTGNDPESGLELQNTVYGALQCSGTPVRTWADLGGNLCIAAGDLKLVGNKAAKLKAPAYSLRWTSPALGKGDASLCTAATDLIGRPRQRQGAIDPGCYATWYDRLGSVLIVR